MLGKPPRMKALESRKQLLIAESELNRAQLACGWRSMTDEVHALSNRAKTIGTMASVAASLFSGIASLRRKSSSSGTAKPGWWQTIFKVAGIAASLWPEIRSQDHRGENRGPPR
jgi:hypothetical protein